MLPRRQENFRWEKKVRKSNEVVTSDGRKSLENHMKLSSTCKLDEDPFMHTATAPRFTIIDQNDDEGVTIED